MSQNSQNEILQPENSNQLSAIEGILKEVLKTMADNFELLHQGLAKVVESNARILSDLTDFMEVICSPQQEQEQQEVEFEIIDEETLETDQELEETLHMFNPVHSTPTAVTFSTPIVNVITPTTSQETLKALEFIQPASSSTSDDSLTEQIQVYVACETCGMAFLRGSMNDSISKHARETPCFPFKCSQCGKWFKKSYSHQRHVKTHSNDSKRKASTMAELEQPQMKRFTPLHAWVQNEAIPSDQNELSTLQRLLSTEQ